MQSDRWLDPPYEKRAPCAGCSALGAIGLGTLALRRIEIVIPVGDMAIIRVAAKAGAFREEILSIRFTLHEVVYGAVMVSFVPQDFGG
jgi:hypothetical protein